MTDEKKKKISIIGIEPIQSDSTKPLTVEDYISAIADNRNRIRVYSGQLISVSGMLLSSSFVIVFFLIKEKYLGTLINFIYISLLLGIVMLIITITFSILSSSIPKPTSMSHFGEKLNNDIIIYDKEYKRLKWGQRALIASMGCFFIGTILVITQSIPYRPAAH